MLRLFSATVATVLVLSLLVVSQPQTHAQAGLNSHDGPRIHELYGCDLLPQIQIERNGLLEQPADYIRFSWAIIEDENGFLMTNLIDWRREELADGRGLRLMEGLRAVVTHWNCGRSERRAVVEYIEMAKDLSGKPIYQYPYAFTPGAMRERIAWPEPFNCAVSQDPFRNDPGYGGWMYVAAPYAIVRYKTGVAAPFFYWTIVEGHRWIYLKENIQRKYVSLVMCDPLVDHTQLIPNAQGSDIFTPDPTGFILTDNISYLPALTVP